jgi:hypothetical protein
MKNYYIISTIIFGLLNAQAFKGDGDVKDKLALICTVELVFLYLQILELDKTCHGITANYLLSVRNSIE